MLFLRNMTPLVAALATVTAQAVPFSSHCETAPGGQICYAINVPSSSTDELYISVSGPSSVGYAGLGFGNVMANSLFFISMPTADNNVTVSVRTASSEVMPRAYTATPITLQILPGTKNSGGTFLVNFLCTGCRTWSTGSLDTTSASAGMIWSTGALASGSSPTDQNAMILYHGQNNGNFNINLQSATGLGGVPNSNAAGTSAVASGAASASGAAASSPAATSSAGTTAGLGNTGSSSTTTRSSNREALWWSHAAFMTIGWILIIGIGAIVIRFFPSLIPAGKAVRVHYSLQLLGVVFVIIGAALGIAGSEGQHFRYAHQTLGVIVFAVMFLQIALGAIHHMMYLKSGPGGNSIMALMHRYLGRSLIVTAMVNAGLAFRLPMVALGKSSQIAWYVVMGVLVLAYTIANLAMEATHGRNTGAGAEDRAKGVGKGRFGRKKSQRGVGATGVNDASSGREKELHESSLGSVSSH